MSSDTSIRVSKSLRDELQQEKLEIQYSVL